MRLIDADALIPIMRYATTDNEIGVFPIRIGFDTIKGVVDDTPTIDAVEVVRCKDCHKGIWKTTDEDELIFCQVFQKWFAETFYCANGERREE